MVWLFLFLALWFGFSAFLFSFEGADDVHPFSVILTAGFVSALFWIAGFLTYHAVMAVVQYVS
jgi:hypothetical protein